MEELFEDVPEAKGALDAFIAECEASNEEYVESDDVGE